MAIYKVINEENETLNESGGAHQKLIKKRHADIKKLEDKNEKLENLFKYLSHTSNSKILKKKVDDDISKNTTEHERKRLIDGRISVKDAHDTIKNSKEGYEPQEWRKDQIRDIKNSLGVGRSNMPNQKTTNLVKYLQDIKRNETFDMCADYIVGCLEGSVDEFDLDLFTEASAFIIDCLDENDE